MVDLLVLSQELKLNNRPSDFHCLLETNMDKREVP